MTVTVPVWLVCLVIGALLGSTVWQKPYAEWRGLEVWFGNGGLALCLAGLLLTLF